MTPIVILQAVTVMAIWGFNFVVAKVAMTELPPLFLMALRFSLAAAVLLPLARLPRGNQWRALFLYSVVMGGIHFPLIFSGVRMVDASTASIAIQLQVPFASILAAIFFKDQLGWRRALGMAISFAGVAVIAGIPDGRTSTPHLLMVIGAALAFAFSNIQLKWLGDVDWKTLNAYMALFAVPQLALQSFLLEQGQIEALRDLSWMGALCLLYLALMATILAYAFWYPLVKRFDVNQTIPFLLLVPIFGVGGGILALGEPLTWKLLVGGLLTIGGVGVIILRRPRLTPGRSTT
ncbi:EamA family transporter [Aerophototrophica crusticola]|uniref:EamA family transporter n=1 Tax=Aerophototrophica crusticola TaxID=1709002 RepID=A0A858R507_9PROT|nr:EamA family transporter [Rhodospirillaceae bacterium B3]